MTGLDDVDNFLSRRKALSALGSTITGVLAGCSSQQTTGTTTTTASDTPTSTPTATASPTPTPTETPTPQSEKNYLIEKPFLPDYRGGIPDEETFPEFNKLIKNNYPVNETNTKLDDAPEHRHGEIIIEGVGEVPFQADLSWPGATSIALTARKAMHDLIDEKHQYSTDPSSNNAGYAFPNPIVIDGGIVHGTDIMTKNGITTNIAEPTSGKPNTHPENTLNPQEKQEYLNGLNNNLDGLDTTEIKLGASYITPERTIEGDSSYRMSNYDSTMSSIEATEEFTPEWVRGFHKNFGKSVPGLYEPGKEVEEVRVWQAESSAKLMDKKIIEGSETFEPFIEMHDEFYNNVSEDQIGILYADEDELRVTPVSDDQFSTDRIWAPEPK